MLQDGSVAWQMRCDLTRYSKDEGLVKMSLRLVVMMNSVVMEWCCEAMLQE